MSSNATRAAPMTSPMSSAVLSRIADPSDGEYTSVLISSWSVWMTTRAVVIVLLDTASVVTGGAGKM